MKMTWLLAMEKTVNTTATGESHGSPVSWTDSNVCGTSREWWMYGNLSHVPQLGSGAAENRPLTVDFLAVPFQRQKC